MFFVAEWTGKGYLLHSDTFESTDEAMEYIDKYGGNIDEFLVLQNTGCV